MIRAVAGLGALLLGAAWANAADLRIGILGTDTSHVIQLTKLFNDASNPEHIPGGKVVAVYKSGSRDIPTSWSRFEKYAEQLQSEYGVELVPDIATLCSKVDDVLLESGDGRVHLAQARLVIAAGKPMFIDKPLASTLEDAREIARLAKEAGVPWFSSSGLRYGGIATTMKYPDATGVTTWGPGPLEEHHHLDLAWYAIHPIEMLYALMGPGCVEATRIAGGDFKAGADIIVGRWKDGRIGTVRALRPYGGYGAVVFRAKEAVESPAKVPFSYVPLARQIMTFFETRQPPVSNEETLEIYAFMDAAQRSKEAGGKPMALR